MSALRHSFVTHAGTKARVAVATALLIGVLGVAPTPATATLAGDITTDLQASGAPVTSVTIETPPPASAPLNRTNSASLTFEQYKPYFSPNYGAPLPIAHIVLSTPTGHPLAGILPTPGLDPSYYTDVSSKRVLWQLAAAEAIKHAIASGASLAAMQLDLQLPGGVAPQRTLFALPDPSTFVAKQSYTSLMPASQVRQQVHDGLPPWAQAATIDVADDRAGERIVTINLQVPSLTFLAHDMRDITEALGFEQASLANNGANIGRTLVQVTDSQTSDPLYVSADDRFWGYRSGWISPLVRGLPGFANPLGSLNEGVSSATSTTSPPSLP